MDDHEPLTPDQLLEHLEALGIHTVTHDHPPLFTVEESKALRGELPGGHCKSLFLKDKKSRLWLLVALEDTPIDLKRLHEMIGASGRLSFGNSKSLWEILGVRPGAVTPFGLINDRSARVTPVLEKAMLSCNPLNYHPLTNERTTAIAPDDLIRFIEACGRTPLIRDLRASDDGTA